MSVVVRFLRVEEQEQFLNIPEWMKTVPLSLTKMSPMKLSLFMDLTHRNIMPSYALLAPEDALDYKYFWYKSKAKKMKNK